MSHTPIADHALLSDRHSAALVNTAGSVEWLSFPRFDSPSVFGRLLGTEAGHWQIQPAGVWHSTRRYLDRTLVLETTFTTDTGTVVLTDLLAMGPDNGGHRLGRHVPHLLVRRATCTDGHVELDVSYEPRPEYGLVMPLLSRVDGGVTARGGADWLVLTTPLPLDLGRSRGHGRATLHQGETMHFALHRSTLEEVPARVWSQDELAAQIDNTIDAWQSWSALHQSYDGPWADLVHHSGRVLQGLSFQPSGAIVAAATTSLPEGVGGERNWDYRYSWVRDASFTMEALWVAACPDEADDFFAFLATAAASGIGPDEGLQIMFGIGGEHDLTERELPHLEGWRDSRPVRVGNGAWNQQQIDVYGELLGAAHRLVDQLGDIDDDTKRFLVACADTAAASWQEKDQGIWEVRGDPQHFLYSKVMCWVALDRAIALAALIDAGDRVEIRRLDRPRRVEPDDADRRLPPCRRSAHARHDRCHRAAADRRTRPRIPLPDRGGSRRTRRRGGNVPALHVLACPGPRAVRSGRPRQRRLREGDRVRQRRRPARRGSRARLGRDARQLPASVQPHRPGQRRVGNLRGGTSRDVGADRSRVNP